MNLLIKEGTRPYLRFPSFSIQIEMRCQRSFGSMEGLCFFGYQFQVSNQTKMKHCPACTLFSSTSLIHDPCVNTNKAFVMKIPGYEAVK